MTELSAQPDREHETPFAPNTRALRFLTFVQVADELETKASTIRALIKSGELPAI